jgi:hypothetical protein
MRPGAYTEGYYAGLVDDAANPHPFWRMASYAAWEAGNLVGRAIHCHVVEHLYLVLPHD